eukprot:237834_1
MELHDDVPSPNSQYTPPEYSSVLPSNQQRMYNENIINTSFPNIRTRKQALYFTQLDVISTALNNIKDRFSAYYIIYILTLMMLVLYRFQSNYFATNCITMLNSFSIAFYLSDVFWIDWCLVAVWILLSALYVISVSTLSTEMAQNKDVHSKYHIMNNDDKKNTRKVTELSDLSSLKVVNSQISSSTVSALDIIHHNVEVNNRTILQYKLYIFGNACFYLMLYVICILLTCLYIICESLPTENVLKITGSTIFFISRSMGAVLTVSNSIVVPKMVDSLHQLVYGRNTLSKPFISQNRTMIIFCLRTMTGIIIPIVASIILLNDCANGWTYFWTECLYNKSKFSIDYVVDEHTYTVNPSIQLSDASEMCGMQPIKWNKCLRQFFYSWTNVIVLKLLLTVIMPFIVTGCIRLRKLCLSKMYHCCGNCMKSLDTKLNGKISRYIDNPVLKIDLEYAMICTKIEIMIIFSFITPLIIPITLLSIYVNLTVYRYLVKEKKAYIFPFNSSFTFIPIHMLVFGIMVSQMFIVLFTWNSIGNIVIKWVLVTSLIVIDVWFLLKKKKQKKK